MKENDRLRDRWQNYFNQLPDDQMITIDNPSFLKSTRFPHFKTAQKLETVKELRKKRLNSISMEHSTREENNLSYNQFINSRYRVKTSNNKTFKGKKYAVI